LDNDLEGKAILVTGGGQGLGAAICTELASAGATVYVAELSDRAEQVAATLCNEGMKAIAMRGDIGDETDVKRLLADVERRGGRLDGVVNNAGIDKTTGVDTLEVRDWDAIIRTNLRGPFLLAKFALPLLRKAQGDVVNVASTAAKRGWPNASAYHASKWGLLGLSYALHAEFREH
jgi:NAD(P)-dependent dehydrogenase (short-subunit alcohol dehydrogenase family)